MKRSRISRQPKKKSLGWYKKKLDHSFSQWIRIKDSVNGVATCVTCGAKSDWKHMQNGHYIARNHMATRYDEQNCNVQCLTEDSTIYSGEGVKSIKNSVVGDSLLAFDENTFEKRIAVIEEASSFMPTELYEVELMDGKKFYATGDHKVVSNNKWITIEEMLHIYPTCDIMEL